MTEIEETFKFDMTPNKAIIIDILLLALILCAFLGGYWYGQKQQAEEKINFFREYIQDSCTCQRELIFTKNNVQYKDVLIPAYLRS